MNHQKLYRILNPYKIRYAKLRWYYKNRAIINLGFYEFQTPEEQKQIEEYNKKIRASLPPVPDTYQELVKDWLTHVQEQTQS